ncbi:hypothetical protein ZWY2020_041609 [Hordeum vulgare]|nr:hypothetical protein ZWY2020_041609 [Hordeum vulgare]
MIKTWLGLHDVHPPDWGGMDSMKEWRGINPSKRTQSQRALVPLMLLILWGIWKERNARVFHNTTVPVGVIVTRIKEEPLLWCLVGAHLRNVMQ